MDVDHAGRPQCAKRRADDRLSPTAGVIDRNGARIVGFDNERGKGDQCHLDGEERPYTFTTLDQLIEDFIAEVVKRRTP